MDVEKALAAVLFRGGSKLSADGSDPAPRGPGCCRHVVGTGLGDRRTQAVHRPRVGTGNGVQDVFIPVKDSSMVDNPYRP